MSAARRSFPYPRLPSTSSSPTSPPPLSPYTSFVTTVSQFWADARRALPHLDEPLPAAWSFGATAEHADELLALVLSRTKTAAASLLAEYEGEEQVPAVGELSIILDGRNKPRAVLETTDVTIVPFCFVTAEHAWSEGEGDRSLDAWREIHERFWEEHSDTEFSESSLVVCERFRVIYPLT